jgi:hypothetical protein
VCAGAGGPACPTTQPAPAGPTPQPAVSSADFSALSERCLASGLKARLMFSHAAGIQSVTLSCSLPTATKMAIEEKRRRRRRRHRGRRRAAITVGANTNPLPYTDVAATAIAAPAGCNVSAPSSPEISTPPPKRKRRRRNEVELLREPEMDGELLLSPLSCAASTPSSSPSSPPAVARHRPPRSYQSPRRPCCRQRRRRPSRSHLRRVRLHRPGSRSRLSRRYMRLPIRHRRQLIRLRRVPPLSLRLRHYLHHHHLLHLEPPISNTGICAKTAKYATMKKYTSAVGFAIINNLNLCECRMNVV